MNHKRIPLVAALPLSLLAAGFAFGQTTPQSMSNQTSRHAQSSRNQADVGAPPGAARRTPPTFGQLAGNAGDISRTGADQYTWLAQHFDQCDNDGNNKISRVEYRSCTGQTTGTSNMQTRQSARYRQSTGQQSPGAFAALAGGKGYVTQREASQASWIKRHFRQCDDNHDGKLNRAEYRQCHSRQSMQDSNMRGSNMRGSNMRGSNMQGSNMQGSNMQGSNMRGSNMQGSNMQGSNMQSQQSSSQSQGHQQGHWQAQSTSNGSMMGDFNDLAGSKGYVTQSEASGHLWLQRHFQQCDDNNDGKVNRAEYRQCRGQQGRQVSNTQSRQASWKNPASQYTEQSNQQSTSNAAAGNFDRFAGGNGYVTQSQVAGNPWLQRHFNQCDSNGDGKLTRSEYAACKRL